MTTPARSTHRRPLRRLAIIAALVAVAAAAFGAAIAGSTPDKPFSAFISAPPSDAAVTTTAATSVGGSVGLRLQNDTRQQELGSANVTLVTPAGMVVPATFATVVTPAGGSATVAGGVIKLRNLSVPPGGSAFVQFGVPCTAAGASYRLAIRVKQSNDFNGTGNDLNLATPAPLLSGTGSCTPCDKGERCIANTSRGDWSASVSGIASKDRDWIA